MRSPRLADLPAPPPGRSGWPWTEETPPAETGGAQWPSISIVIPSYNQARFVEETLRAVLLQGYPHLELLFAEDGSTDGTAEVVTPYRPWLTWLPAPENLGMSNAINRGFRRAGGEIVTWIATDDVYLPGAFQRVAERFRQRRDCGALVGGVQFIDHRSRPVGEPRAARLEHPAPLDLSIAPPESWRLHQAATFYTAAGLELAGRYVREDLHYVMDRELIIRVARRRPVELIEETLTCFRLHRESKSWSSEKILDFADEFARLQDAFPPCSRAERVRRAQIKRTRRIKGYLRYGVRGDRIGRRVGCLLRAAALRPTLLAKRSYWVRWLAAVRLEEPLRRLLGRPGVSLTRGI